MKVIYAVSSEECEFYVANMGNVVKERNVIVSNLDCSEMNYCRYKLKVLGYKMTAKSDKCEIWEKESCTVKLERYVDIE